MIKILTAFKKLNQHFRDCSDIFTGKNPQTFQNQLILLNFLVKSMP